MQKTVMKKVTEGVAIALMIAMGRMPKGVQSLYTLLAKPLCPIVHGALWWPCICGR